MANQCIHLLCVFAYKMLFLNLSGPHLEMTLRTNVWIYGARYVPYNQSLLHLHIWQWRCYGAKLRYFDFDFVRISGQHTVSFVCDGSEMCLCVSVCVQCMRCILIVYSHHSCNIIFYMWDTCADTSHKFDFINNMIHYAFLRNNFYKWFDWMKDVQLVKT